LGNREGGGQKTNLSGCGPKGLSIKGQEGKNHSEAGNSDKNSQIEQKKRRPHRVKIQAARFNYGIFKIFSQWN